MCSNTGPRPNPRSCEVTTVEFQAREYAEPSLDLIEIPLIDIHSNDPLCGVAVDLV
jgi:hypothetical protein